MAMKRTYKMTEADDANDTMSSNSSPNSEYVSADSEESDHRNVCKEMQSGCNIGTCSSHTDNEQQLVSTTNQMMESNTNPTDETSQKVLKIEPRIGRLSVTALETTQVETSTSQQELSVKNVNTEDEEITLRVETKEVPPCGDVHSVRISLAQSILASISNCDTDTIKPQSSNSAAAIQIDTTVPSTPEACASFAEPFSQVAVNDDFSPASPTADFDENNVTTDPNDDSNSPIVCTESQGSYVHVAMCRAASSRYLKGSDIDGLVAEDENSNGGAVFSEKVPDLVVDERDYNYSMFPVSDEDEESSDNSGAHSPVGSSLASSGYNFPTQTSDVSEDEAASGQYNLDESRGAVLEDMDNNATFAEDTNNDGANTNNTNGDHNAEDDSADDDFMIFRGRWTERRRRKISTVNEPNPYIPPPVPKTDWRALTHLQYLKQGIITPLKHRTEVIRSQHFVQRWDREALLNGHRGCINTLNFNDKGNILVSSGDDLNVILWDWYSKKKITQYESGHHSNVFNAKFLPHCNDTSIVSVARDGHVRHASLSSTGTAFTTKLAHHKLSAHKLSVMRSEPCQFLTAGEDGYVFHLDIRLSYSKKPLPVLTVNDEKERPIELYSIDCCPANENMFLVCGRDPSVVVYDRRNLEMGPVCKYRPNNIAYDDYRMSITSAVYSRIGTEIAASYSDEDIYVFDVNQHQLPCTSDERIDSDNSSQEDLREDQLSDHTHVESTEIKKPPKKFFGHRNCQTVKGVNFLGPNSEFVVSGSDDGYIYVWNKENEKIVQWLPGDESGVVNVLEPHPTLPYMASSGLDHCVKIWSPKRPTHNNLMGLASVMAQNKKKRDTDPIRDGLFDARMLMLLMQNLSNPELREMDGGLGLQPDHDDSDNLSEGLNSAELRDGDGENSGGTLGPNGTIGCRTS